MKEGDAMYTICEIFKRDIHDPDKLVGIMPPWIPPIGGSNDEDNEE